MEHSRLCNGAESMWSKRPRTFVGCSWTTLCPGTTRPLPIPVRYWYFHFFSNRRIIWLWVLGVTLCLPKKTKQMLGVVREATENVTSSCSKERGRFPGRVICCSGDKQSGYHSGKGLSVRDSCESKLEKDHNFPIWGDKSWEKMCWRSLKQHRTIAQMKDGGSTLDVVRFFHWLYLALLPLTTPVKLRVCSPFHKHGPPFLVTMLTLLVSLSSRMSLDPAAMSKPHLLK